MQVGLGRDFNRMWLASAVSNLGDGLILGAVPVLLAATITDNPILMSSTVGVSLGAKVLASLPAGVFVDRHPRKALFIRVSFFRAAVVGLLGLCVATDRLSIPLLWVLLAALAFGEAFADAASVAMLPEVVADEHLPKANSRLITTLTVTNDMIGISIGPKLFVAAAGLPFFIDSITFFTAAVLMLAVNTQPKHQAQVPIAPGSNEPQPSVLQRYRDDISESLHFLKANPTARAFVFTALPSNLAAGALLGTLILYFQRWLGLAPEYFGLLMLSMSIGLVIGSYSAQFLMARFAEVRWILAAVIMVEGLTDFGMGLTRSVPLVFTLSVVGGIAIGIFIVTGATVRQRLTPPELQGRMQSTYALLGQCAIPFGTVVGGVLVDRFDERTPLLFSGVVLVCCGLIVIRATQRSLRAA